MSQFLVGLLVFRSVPRSRTERMINGKLVLQIIIVHRLRLAN